jgi:hypothetical protein
MPSDGMLLIGSVTFTIVTAVTIALPALIGS